MKYSIGIIAVVLSFYCCAASGNTSSNTVFSNGYKPWTILEKTQDRIRVSLEKIDHVFPGEQTFTSSDFLVYVQSGQLLLSISSDDAKKAQVTVKDNPIYFKGIPLTPVHVEWQHKEENHPDNEIVEFELERINGSSVRSNDQPIRVSADLARYLRSRVLELDEMHFNEIAPLGGMLILYPPVEGIEEILSSYIAWKKQLGYPIQLEQVEDLGTQEVQSIIRSHYLNDDDPLEYVLLIGDTGGAIHIPTDADELDNFYGNLTASPVPEVAVGRMSVRDLTTLRRVILKTIRYEQNLDPEDMEWLNNACLTAGAGSGFSLITSSESIRILLENHEIESNTMWYTDGGNITDFIVNTVNTGAGFVNYRGLIGMEGWNSQVNSRFANTSNFPILFTITCGTGAFYQLNECITEGLFRSGTGGNTGTGPVACIGTAGISSHTRFNNLIDVSLFEAALMLNVRPLGWALVHAKQRMEEVYINTGDEEYIDNFCEYNNLIGDPSLRMWVGEARIPEVGVQAQLRAGQQTIDIQVEVEGGLPELVWATVAVESQNDGWLIRGKHRIDSSGHLNLPISSINTFDTVLLTVAGDNLITQQIEIPVIDEDVDVILESYRYDDAHGGEESAQAGDSLLFEFRFENISNDNTTERTCFINFDDPLLYYPETLQFTIPPLSPGEFYEHEVDTWIPVPPWIPDQVKATFECIVTGDIWWSSDIPVRLNAWMMVSEGDVSWRFNELPAPGEAAQLRLNIRNAGHEVGISVEGTLSSLTPWITVLDSTSGFGNVFPEDESLSSSYFQVAIHDTARAGAPFNLQLVLGERFEMVDTVFFRGYIGGWDDEEYLGPDSSGYFALFDAIDIPWTDIQRIGTRLPLDDDMDEGDASVVVDLPFEFSYYDQTYEQITVCSNGWLAFGAVEQFVDFRNWRIPSPLGPPAMLAAFLDDLRTTDGGVYIWLDHRLNRLIIQWQCQTALQHRNQVFQISLLDPESWVTQTENGRILFQYENVAQLASIHSDNDFATIGIESPDETTGLEYYWWDENASGTPELEDISTILFTDEPNLDAIQPSLELSPNQFNWNIRLGTSLTDTLFIQNTSLAPIHWEIELLNEDPNFIALNNSSTQAHFWSEETGSTPIFEQDGPDIHGYFWIDSNEPDGPEFSWIEDYGEDITDQLSDLDDGEVHVELPFYFNWYGKRCSTIAITTNGYIVPGETNEPVQFENLRIPFENAPSPMLAPFWTNLDFSHGGSLHFQNNGLDSAWITWAGVQGWNWANQPPRGGPYEFQVLLTANGEVLYSYNNMIHDGDTRLDECTIGFQNWNADAGFTINYNTADYLQNNLSINIQTPTSWLAFAEDEGVVLPGEMLELQVYANGALRSEGNYNGYLSFHSNDTEEPERSIETNLTLTQGHEPPTVSGIPDQEVYQGESFAPVDLDEYVTDPNYPDERIRWQLTTEYPLVVELEDRIVTISKLDSTWTGTAQVVFLARNPENYSDSDTATYSIQLSGLDNFQEVPFVFSIGEPYPNPFNPSLSIPVQLPERRSIKLEVFNLMGQLVECVHYNELTPGHHTLIWSGYDIPTGLYFIQLTSAKEKFIFKSLLLR